jgi:hypothetical protein
VQNNPYLGLQISDDLKWTTHITNVTKKANSTLCFLRRNLKYCPKDCKKTAYISLVRSTMEYAIWSNSMGSLHLSRYKQTRKDPKESSEIYHRGLQIKKRRRRNKNAGGIRTGEYNPEELASN